MYAQTNKFPRPDTESECSLHEADMPRAIDKERPAICFFFNHTKHGVCYGALKITVFWGPHNIHFD